MKSPPHPIAVFVLFAALSVLWTWPLATQIASRIAFDPGDPLLNAWILWWNAQAVPFTEAWWSPPIFYPMRGALALSEHLAGIAPFTSPLLLLGGTPAFAYNIALLLSYTLSGLFAYQLVFHLTRSPIAALCGALAYAFAPFRAGQLSHLQVLTSQWLPLQLLGLHLYLDTGRRRALALFGIAWVLQALSNGYYLLFAPVLVALWVAWFVVLERRWRALGAIAAATVLASLPLLPAVLGYRAVHGALGLVRGRTEITQFNAGPLSFLNPPHMLALWPPRPVRAIEDYLFPGLTVVLVIAAAAGLALLRRRAAAPARAFWFYAGAALVMAALTFGPAPPDAGLRGWLKPYHWLVHLPGYDGLRVPARYGMLVALCLAVSAGLGLARLLPRTPRARALAGAVVAVGIALDGLMDPVGVTAPPGRVELPLVPNATVLELPPDDASVSVAAMFRSMSHRRPLVNGYSGYIPPHYAILSHSLRRDDPSAIVELARGRTLLVIVSPRSDPGNHFRDLVERIPGIQRGEISGAGQTYVLRAQPRERRPPQGEPYSFTVSRLPRAHVVVDLGARRTVRAIESKLLDRYEEFGARFAIETSDDNRLWQTAWEDWTGGHALAGALEDQREVPIRFVLPDLPARYLRLHAVEPWFLENLGVRGP